MSSDPASATEFQAESVAQFVTILEGIQKHSGAVLWYQGVGSIDFKLVPSLYRQHSASRTDADWRLELEAWLLERFSERSGPFRDGPQPGRQIELLFEMQHYGVPTRLLDWSENALVALWFAVETHHGADSAVWVMNAPLWNNLVFAQQSGIKNILSPHSLEIENRQPWAVTSNQFLLEAPTCIYGVHNTKRIVGQRGVFSLSGRSIEPVEEQSKKLAHAGAIKSTDLLQRIVIPESRRQAIKEQLITLGFSYSMMFPDMSGLAKELNERLSESGML
ncbi:MAG: FRG domain-containing protein [Rhodospirillales bacterium]|nr:FRG domain-containing protein [Acetobacter sp.]